LIRCAEHHARQNDLSFFASASGEFVSMYRTGDRKGRPYAFLNFATHESKNMIARGDLMPRFPLYPPLFLCHIFC